MRYVPAPTKTRHRGRIKPHSVLPTLLFLPGTLCDRRVWHETHRQLDCAWPCVFVDYRYQTSIVAMAEKALADVEGAVIPIGVSMGAIVALEIWRQAARRVVALALFDTDPSADTPERRNRRDAQLLAMTSGNFREVVRSQLLPGYFSATQPPDQHAENTVMAMAVEHGAQAFAAQSRALTSRPNGWPLLRQITVPTLVACGADDRICRPEIHEAMASTIPEAFVTYRTIANAGHLSPLAQPKAVASLLQAWLAGMVIRQPCAPEINVRPTGFNLPAIASAPDSH